MGGSQAAMAWIDGADFAGVLLAFGIGFATGVAIHFATKALSSLTKKITAKFRANSQLANNPLDGKVYSYDVIEKMGLDKHHNFPQLVDNFGGDGVVTTIFNKNGTPFTQVHIYGGYGQYNGRFEYIINKDGIITHRFFRILNLLRSLL